MRKIGLILVCCLFYTSLVLAQSLRVTGKVIDAEDGSPMIGVTVAIQNSQKGTTTNLDGNYSIEAQKNDVLVFSYIGKSSKTVTVKSQSRIDVKLSDDVNQLNDVVIVGYGTMKKRDLTGAISQVKGDELMKGNSSLSINSALQGKIAGMQVKQNDGAPGAGLTIQVRGANSFSTDTQPLYVVDGLPYGGGGGAPDTGLSGTGSGSNPLANINPNDIESIEVLKDASSTAIYGSRGANGVVIITTKRGKEGKNNITFSANFNMSKVAKKIDVLDPVTYAKYMNEQTYNSDPLAQLPYRGEWYYNSDTQGNILTNTGKYSPAPEDYAHPGVYTDEYGNTYNVGSTDWQDAIFQTGSTQEYNISLDGGNAQGGYMMSLNYTNQKGIIVGSDYKRFAVRSNLWRKMTSWLEAGLNINYTNAVTNFVNSSTSGGDGVIYSALVFPTTYDSSINTKDENELNWLAANPYVYVREAFDEYRANNIYLSSYFEATLAKGLKLRENLGFNYSNNDRNMYYNRLTRQGYEPTNGTGGQGTSWSQGLTSETLLSYNQTFNEDHAINALAGITFEESNWKYNRMSAYDFPSDLTKMWDMSAANKVYPLASGRGKKRMQSNLARLGYSYKGKYMATASYRADGSSVFVEGNKYAHFLSGALAWRISAEPWMERLHAFDDLKLRLSYGQTGNQGIDTYATLPAMSVAGYVFGNSLSSGYAEQTWKGPINRNLKWETTDQVDVGLDISFANSRVNFTVDYYYKRTRDLLQKVNIETNSGYTQMATNIGNVTNSGLEIAGSFHPYVHKNLEWKIDANISFNRNRIGGLTGDQYASNFVNGIKNVFVLRNGCPIGTVVGFVEDGFYDNIAEVRADARYANISDGEAKNMIGEIKYRDYNNDGQITDADKRVIGDTNPDFIYGLTNTMQYKNITFSFFLQGTYGNDIVNANTITNNTSASMTGISNITREQYDTRWTAENPQAARWPKAVASGYTREWRFTDRYIEDGSYLRLKNISLGYTFFPKWKGIGSINVTATASNLFTITKYSWYDPDVNAFGGDVSRQGVDLYSYPSSRTYSLGLQILF